METKTYSFEVSYGMFTENLSYGELNLCMKIAHRKTVLVKLDGDDEMEMQISCITAITPKIYYSGNRKYGKYLFIVPENIKVVKNVFSGDSNDEAFTNNTSLLKGGTHDAASFGFDFFKITKIGDEEISMEVSKKITKLEFLGLGDLEEMVFFQNAMPDNISGIFNQTSGWSRNSEETHLHAVMEEIKDLLETFVDWAIDCGEGAWYIFDNTEEAIERFLKQRE